ncbi:tRNA delta2-isopentenylpyrophosphate transferase [Nitzschia inconspicua]|uniref:tRNA delta2-isopentenylpyrophosphate transferase n=1 Tax=Nitzschia inconspicua TaxID=303405 RepID=A0A9K3LHP6_9STRA|nr:tRNA delta2-isopentenylpyrophosphate transferase [Nitzschia inconspicua]KAG7362257.1 tRNA delta2-isopentenylpyrophosphate transferase [Nitzschia inconspicua]
MILSPLLCCHSLLKPTRKSFFRYRSSVTVVSVSPQSIVRSTDTNKRMAQRNPPMVVVIAGPTATGKSDVAARLCQHQLGMIVSADSVQAYRGVQIGANKPTLQERRETPHVLIDVADHQESYNAAEWREDALYCIQTLLLQEQYQSQEIPQETDHEEENAKTRRQDEIQQYIQQSRKTILSNNVDADKNIPLLPVVCGGTMMYLQWLVHGRPDACRPTAAAIQESYSLMENFQRQQDYQAAVEYVSSFGDVFAKRTQQFCGEDWYRLRRTLEIALTVQEQGHADKNTSKSVDNHDASTEQQQQQQQQQQQTKMDVLVENLYSGQRLGGLGSLGYDVRGFFLCPDDRMSHTQVVDERCEQMIIKGLVKETTDLKLSGRLPEMAERAIGYRQTLDYLHKELGTGESEEGLFENYLNDFTTATRRYAKKQMSWFRKDEEFLFVPVPLALDKAERVDVVSKRIDYYCQLSREDYDKALRDADSDSARCKNQNEAQGKSMKFYQFQRHILKPGSQEYANALAEGIESRKRIRATLSSTKKRTIDDVV